MINEDKRPRAPFQAIVLTLVVALLSSGNCSLFRSQGPPPALREDFSQLPPGDFPAKIKQLEDLSQNDKSPAVRARATFYIALAYMHYNNPAPDYAKAGQYLDTYIGLKPKGQDIDEIVAWKSIVTSLDRALREYEKLEKSYAQLKQQFDSSNKNRDLLAKRVNELGLVIANQKKEMESLKETIKKLDTVQQEIEKKRKGIKK